jgi:hypothetical protein
MTKEKLQKLKDEAHWDIVWQTFDAVNEGNDTEKIIDITCLELADA